MRIASLATLFSIILSTGCARQEPAPPATASAPTATTTAAENVTRCTPGGDRLCPVDEAAQESSFVAYRNDLLEAVRRKDEIHLLGLIDENIRTTFGSGGGAPDLRQRWHTESPDSRLWAELENVLELGGSYRGSREDRMFWAPYVYSKWPENVDAFTHLAAVRAGVPLHEKPSAESKVVLVMDWSMLEWISDRRKDWRHVRTATGVEGWVDADDIRSPIGYRAGFSRKSGTWKMTAFVAGD